MPKLIVVFTLFFTQTIFAQKKIDFSNGFNVVKDFSKEYQDIEKQLGEASKIVKGEIEQLFCGVTRGQNVYMYYEKFGVKLDTWKRLGYVNDNEIGRGKNYYKNCALSEAFIRGNSILKINDFTVNEFTSANIVANLGKAISIDSTEIDETENPFAITSKSVSEIEETLTDVVIYVYEDRVSESYFSFYFLLNGTLLFIDLSGSN